MVTNGNGNGNGNSKVAYMSVYFHCDCLHKMGPQPIYQQCHCHQSPCEQSHLIPQNPFMKERNIEFLLPLLSQCERALTELNVIKWKHNQQTLSQAFLERY